VNNRITRALLGSLIPSAMYVVFSGNVDVQPVVYSPGESVMTVIQEAADAEWPGVANVFCDRLGRLCFHGRHARFDPTGVASGASPGAWEYVQWTAGDRTAVLAHPGMARINRFAFNRGLSKIINRGLATPKRDAKPLTDTEMTGQTVN